MTKSADRRASQQMRDSLIRLSAVIAWAVLVLGAVVLVGGWLAGVDVLVRLRPTYAAMVPSTALCFILITAALLLKRRATSRLRRLAARFAAAAVAAIALLDLALLVGGAHGVDALFWPTSDAFRTNAMAFATAFDFLIAAFCLVPINAARSTWRRAYVIAATVGLLSACVGVLGYAFDASALYEVSLFTAMALHTAVAFVLVFAAFLLARPALGWVGLLTGPGSGSAGARRLFPVVVVGSFLLCYAALQATERGLLNENFRLSLLAIAMMAISAVALLRNARIENEVQRRLLRTVAELDATVRDKDLLLREVNHRVKNNLQQINAMIWMERRRQTDPLAERSLDALSGRIYAIGLIHHKLIQNHLVSEASIHEFLNTLAAETRCGFDLDSRGIECHVTSIEEPLNLDLSISIGLLVNELLTNAIKHAFPDDASGAIRIDFRRDESGDLELTVADNGVGKPEGAAAGIGSRIIDSLVSQLRAKADVKTDGGTRWRIVIPASANREQRHG